MWLLSTLRWLYIILTISQPVKYPTYNNLLSYKHVVLDIDLKRTRVKYALRKLFSIHVSTSRPTSIIFENQ